MQDDLFSTTDWRSTKKRGPAENDSGGDSLRPDREFVMRGMREIVEGFRDELLPVAAARTGISVDQLRKRLKTVDLQLASTVNGCVHKNDHGESFTIEINLGLMLFYHRVCKLFASRINTDHSTGSSMPFSETVAIAADFIEAYLRGKMLPTRSIDIHDLTEQQQLLAAVLRDYAERFAVAHEFGHLILSITEARQTKSAEAAKLLQNAIGQLPASQLGNVFFDHWANEVAADIIGLELCQNIMMRHPYTISYGFLGVETMFITHHMLEIAYERVTGRTAMSKSHPPSMIRLHALRSIIANSLLAPFLQLGELQEQLATMILNSLPPIKAA